MNKIIKIKGLDIGHCKVSDCSSISLKNVMLKMEVLLFDYKIFNLFLSYLFFFLQWRYHKNYFNNKILFINLSTTDTVLLRCFMVDFTLINSVLI